MTGGHLTVNYITYYNKDNQNGKGLQYTYVHTRNTFKNLANFLLLIQTVLNSTSFPLYYTSTLINGIHHNPINIISPSLKEILQEQQIQQLQHSEK